MTRYVPIVDATDDAPHSERVFAYASKRQRRGKEYDNINISVGSIRLSFARSDLDNFLDDLDESLHRGNVMITCGERSAVISAADAERVVKVLSGVRDE